VNVDFPVSMIESLDREARRLGLPASQSSRCGSPSTSNAGIQPPDSVGWCVSPSPASAWPWRPAASLYRYVDTREDLLDLMIDATGAEYVFAAPTGDWLADLLDIGDQARAIMRRHPWLPSLLITRSVLGPNGLVLLEHVLKALAGHPASLAAKLEAFAILNTTTALFVQNELGGGSARQQRNAAYLNHTLATGRYPQLAELLAAASPAQASPAEAAAEPADRYRDILARILSGLLLSPAGSGPDVELFGMVPPGQ
jgi:hypothetical protein